jgi:hypothetical protein
VGSYYKTPRDPVWVVGSASHFTVLFGIDRGPVTETRAELLLAAASRAFKACDPDENGFIARGKLGDVLACLARPTTAPGQPEALAPPAAASSGPSAAAAGAPLLPGAVAHDVAAVDALTAHLETAGAGIILWDDFWRYQQRRRTLS